jgi:hypothetical protein
MRPLVPALLASAIPVLAGCSAIPQLLAPQAAAPAPSVAGTQSAPTAAELAEKTPSASSMQKSDYAERTMTIGAGELRMTLPCSPAGDDPVKDQSELGPLRLKTFSCDYEGAGQSFTVLTTRFERALAPTITDSDRNAKSASIAKILAREACQGFKESGVTCKVGTPLLVGGVASVNVKVTGGAPLALQVEAQYPYAVGVIVTAPEGAGEATSRALGSLKMPAP